MRMRLGARNERAEANGAERQVASGRRFKGGQSRLTWSGGGGGVTSEPVGDVSTCSKKKTGEKFVLEFGTGSFRLFDINFAGFLLDYSGFDSVLLNSFGLTRCIFVSRASSETERHGAIEGGGCGRRDNVWLIFLFFSSSLRVTPAWHLNRNVAHSMHHGCGTCWTIPRHDSSCRMMRCIFISNAVLCCAFVGFEYLNGPLPTTSLGRIQSSSSYCFPSFDRLWRWSRFKFSIGPFWLASSLIKCTSFLLDIIDGPEARVSACTLWKDQVWYGLERQWRPSSGLLFVISSVCFSFFIVAYFFFAFIFFFFFWIHRYWRINQLSENGNLSKYQSGSRGLVRFLSSFFPFFFLPFTSNADKRFNHSTNLPPFCVEIRCDWNVFIPCLPTLEFRSIFIWFILWNAHEIKCRRWNKNQ